MSGTGDTVTVKLFAGLELRTAEPRSSCRIEPHARGDDDELHAGDEVALSPLPGGG